MHSMNSSRNDSMLKRAGRAAAYECLRCIWICLLQSEQCLSTTTN